MFRAVIFDMDGVIIDSEPIYHKIEMEMCRKIGLGVSEEQQRAYAGTKVSEMWAELKEKYGFKQSVEELVRLEAERYRRCIASMSGLEPVSGVFDLIEGLWYRNALIALASSSLMEDIEMVLRIFNIKSFFKLTVSGYEVKRGKPEPDIFELTARRLGVLPSECVVIEDSCNGVRAAKSAGMKCVGYRNINSGNQDLLSADMVVDSLKDLDYEKLKQLCEGT